MKKVGVTGGMGCGKSTILAEFAKLGIASFEADRAGAACYTDAQFLSELRSLMGDDVFDSSGHADKKRIAAKVFADSHLLQKLNALVHPRVMGAFDRFCQAHSSDPYVLFESAILFDYGFNRQMDAVICVYLSLDDRLNRLTLRDGVSRAELKARIASQMAAEEMMRRADYVILNYEGNPRQRQVAYIDKLLRQ